MRITAQLVRAGDGVQLWSENYDRELTDIFAIQEEIAEAIAGALRVPLGLQQGECLVSNRTNDLDSYQQYLRARALLRARSIVEAIAILEPVVARDPGYAPAWALLAQAYSLVRIPRHDLRGSRPHRRGAPVEQLSSDKAEKAAREAIRLDSRNAYGYTRAGCDPVSRGKVGGSRRSVPASARARSRTILKRCTDYSQDARAALGSLKESLELREQLARRSNPSFRSSTASPPAIMHRRGQNDGRNRHPRNDPPDAREYRGNRATRPGLCGGRTLCRSGRHAARDYRARPVTPAIGRGRRAASPYRSSKGHFAGSSARLGGQI